MRARIIYIYLMFTFLDENTTFTFTSRVCMFFFVYRYVDIICVAAHAYITYETHYL